MGLADNVQKKIAEIARNVSDHSVSIGFMAGAQYPNGTPVAMVAFWNEFGTKGHARADAPHPDAIAEGERREPELVGGAPPRPFFRRMIAQDSPEWVAQLKQALIQSDGNWLRALALMGEEIQGALVKSINDFTTPPLAASTIRRKGFAKPLIDTSLMVKSVTYVLGINTGR